MKLKRTFLAALLLLLISLCSSLATDTYDYKPGEYLTISQGVSPNKAFTIKAGSDKDSFHLYLFAGATKVGPLSEVVNVLDTGAGSYAAKWSEDSKTVTIVYRVDRHAPFKSITYSLEKNRAVPATKQAVDVKSRALEDYWVRYGSGTNNPDGSPRKSD